MKPIMIFCCLVLCCIGACKKDKGGRNYWGEVSVSKNGQPWSGDIVALPSKISDSKIDIIIQSFGEDEIPLDNLYFFKVPKQVGKYPLSYTPSQPPDDSLVGAQYFHGYDDLLYDVYDTAKNDSTSYLEITQYDKRKGEIWGKFDLTLYRTLAGSVDWPDSLVFTNGTFHTRIDD